MEIYVSSLALLTNNPEQIIRIAVDHNWPLEFSSGMPYRADMEQLYLDARIKKMPHNYFPAPKIPFVLNLASAKKEIRQQSIAHCISGLYMASKSGSPFFAAHAGFCIDPDPNELGKKITYSQAFDREHHKQLFVDSVKEILQIAEQTNTPFLIENNVIAPFNLSDVNPLLCCESAEINWLFDTVKHRQLGLLLDTAHLKVSCRSLGLDLDNEFKKISHQVRGIHHSDNTGLADTNAPLKSDYWFLPYVPAFRHLVHVLEVRDINESIIKEQFNLLQAHGN